MEYIALRTLDLDISNSVDSILLDNPDFILKRYNPSVVGQFEPGYFLHVVEHICTSQETVLC